MNCEEVIMKKWCLEVFILYTGKQGMKYGTVALTDLSRNGSSENSVFRVNALTFSIITPKVFIICHLFQHSHVPKQIRN